jgi:hypothetical protein
LDGNVAREKTWDLLKQQLALKNLAITDYGFLFDNESRDFSWLYAPLLNLAAEILKERGEVEGEKALRAYESFLAMKFEQDAWSDSAMAFVKTHHTVSPAKRFARFF